MTTRLAAFAVLAGLSLGACASDDDSGSVASPSPTAASGDRGWLEGEPDWAGEPVGGDAEYATAATTTAATG